MKGNRAMAKQQYVIARTYSAGEKREGKEIVLNNARRFFGKEQHHCLSSLRKELLILGGCKFPQPVDRVTLTVKNIQEVPVWKM